MSNKIANIDTAKLLKLETYCREQYIDEWHRIYDAEINNNSSESVKKSVQLEAQRKAIDKSFSALLNFDPSIDEKTIWAVIAKVHKLYFMHLEDFGIPNNYHAQILDKCISAHQSWIKASGHSFERYIASLHNPELDQNEIRFILQSELTKLINDGLLKNSPEDINGLKKWGKDFDLYAIQTNHGSTRVFGCIQSKTSIRDRVGRDRSFSENAMDALFWSAAVTLDGAFLNMPEFIHMVNGGASYQTNSWHGMYAMSGITANNDRIYKTDVKLDAFLKHAIIAANQFISDRRKLDRAWKAE